MRNRTSDRSEHGSAKSLDLRNRPYTPVEFDQDYEDFLNEYDVSPHGRYNDYNEDDYDPQYNFRGNRDEIDYSEYYDELNEPDISGYRIPLRELKKAERPIISKWHKRTEGPSRSWEYNFNNDFYPDRNRDLGHGVSVLSPGRKVDRSYYSANMREQERFVIYEYKHEPKHMWRYFSGRTSYTELNNF